MPQAMTGIMAPALNVRRALAEDPRQTDTITNGTHLEKVTHVTLCVGGKTWCRQVEGVHRSRVRLGALLEIAVLLRDFLHLTS